MPRKTPTPSAARAAVGRLIADPARRSDAVRWGAAATVAALGIAAFVSTGDGPDVAVAADDDRLASIDVGLAPAARADLDAQDTAAVDRAFDRFLERLYTDDAAPTTRPAQVVEDVEEDGMLTSVDNPFASGEESVVVEASEASASASTEDVESSRASASTGSVESSGASASTGDVGTFEASASASTQDVKAPAALASTGDVKVPGASASIEVGVPAEPEGLVTTLLADEAEVEPEPTTEIVPTAAPAPAETPAAPTRILADGQIDDGGAIRVTVNDSRVVETTRPFYRVAIAKDQLATVQPISPTQLLVTAKQPGTTQIVFWDENDHAETLLLRSGADLRQVQGKLDELLPGEGVRVVDLGGKLGLTGTVSDLAVAERAGRVAGGYGEVENFLDLAGEQQVSLRIRFAEVSRTAGKEFGVNLGYQDPDDVSVIGSNVGQIGPFGFGENPDTGLLDRLRIPTQPGQAVQLFGLFGSGDDTFSVLVNALRDANLLRILADPELVVLSGEEGSFLAGGSYPVPIPQEEGIAIEYREFGVKLIYQPIVLGNGRIRMRLTTEVSDLDETIGVATGGVQVPGERIRSTTTTVELLEGQTLAISGLIRSRTVANKQAVPLLGDVPILGSLFRSVRYLREETELVVLITPRLAAALDEVPPAPGEQWQHPDDVELMLFGQLGGAAEVELPGDDHPRAGGPPRLQTGYTFIEPDPAGE